VGKAAREEIKAFPGREVHLFLTGEGPAELAGGGGALREMGLEFPKGE
jgi:hypothetical protein